MKPSKISNIMDLARRARNMGETFNPLFVGPPGVGKSQIVQQWCNSNSLPFIDFRTAYREAPDFIGYPELSTVNGKQKCVFYTPEFWPDEGEGVLLLEEPNRGNASVMNCLMQLLTDRRVDKYILPKGWIIAGCINPETGEYDVNTMDPALKDRFEIFQVTYDKHSHIEYMNQAKWKKEIIQFVEAGIWSYLPPESINLPGSKYISPRTLSKLNAAMQAGFDQQDEMLIYETILGANVGKDFYKFRNDESPILMHDLNTNLEAAIRKLKRFSNPNNYKSSMVSLTVKDIIEDGSISDDMLAAVLKAIPIDHATPILRELEYKRKDPTLFHRMCALCPQFKDQLRAITSAL